MSQISDVYEQYESDLQTAMDTFNNDKTFDNFVPVVNVIASGVNALFQWCITADTNLTNISTTLKALSQQISTISTQTTSTVNGINDTLNKVLTQYATQIKQIKRELSGNKGVQI